MASVLPAQCCTSPHGVVLVGWEDGVGHCRGAASFPENGLFISLGVFYGELSYAIFFWV